MVKARKIAAKGGRIAGSGAGGFLTGVFSSPAGLGAIGIITLLGIIFIFREQIGKAIGGFGENIGKVELPSLPDITFPSLPDITFPTFEFPDITFPKIEFPNITFPEFNIGDFGLGDPVEAIGAAGETITNFFGDLQEQFDNFISGVTPDAPLTEADQFDFSGLEGGVSPEPTGQPAPPFSDAAIFAEDFPEPFVPIQPEQDFGVTIAPSLVGETEGFIGGGTSFEGGTIFETPIANLSLSQIIDKFMVTASQAADIKAQAIGFTPEEEAFLTQGQEISPLGDVASQPAVSDPQFEGLTPEQIFAQLVGGNISNF